MVIQGEIVSHAQLGDGRLESITWAQLRTTEVVSREPIGFHLRELPTPVIASEARGLGPFCTRSRTRFRTIIFAEPSQKGAREVRYDVRLAQRTLARNGGHGSTQNDEEKNIRFGDLRSANFCVSDVSERGEKAKRQG